MESLYNAVLVFSTSLCGFFFFSYILIIYIKCIFYVYFKIIAALKLLIASSRIISQRHEDYLGERGFSITIFLYPFSDHLTSKYIEARMQKGAKSEKEDA